jgi:hypothetical protein
MTSLLWILVPACVSSRSAELCSLSKKSLGAAVHHLELRVGAGVPPPPCHVLTLSSTSTRLDAPAMRDLSRLAGIDGGSLIVDTSAS